MPDIGSYHAPTSFMNAAVVIKVVYHHTHCVLIPYYTNFYSLSLLAHGFAAASMGSLQSVTRGRITWKRRHACRDHLLPKMWAAAGILMVRTDGHYSKYGSPETTWSL